jgi:hypothetical protein
MSSITARISRDTPITFLAYTVAHRLAVAATSTTASSLLKEMTQIKKPD